MAAGDKLLLDSGSGDFLLLDSGSSDFLLLEAEVAGPSFIPAWALNNNRFYGGGLQSMAFKKNTAVTGFTVGLVDASDGSDITTGTPVGYYTLDGGTQTAIGDVTPVHEGNGQWSFDLTAGEMNGDVVGLTFTHASAITASFTIKTDTVLTSDLNDFDPAADTVANVTAVATTTDVTNQVTANMAAISGDSIAADNLESMYDGTGYVDDNAPATQVQLGQLSVGTAAISKAATTAVVTTGTEVNTWESTKTADGVYHEVSDVGGSIDFYYEFDVGTDGIGVDVAFKGRMVGPNDDLGIYAYNWGTTTWDQIGAFQGSSSTSDVSAVADIYLEHTGSGADDGKVRVRAYKASGLTSATIYMEHIYASYTTINTLSASDVTVDIDANSTKLAAIETDTSTTLPAQITALNDISVTDILTTQMTESYAADGVAPTISQALMLLQQSLGDFAISGTTITIKQLDGTTTAATFTTDSATSATSSTRTG